MTLRAVVPERKTSDVTPSEMGVQLLYEPMRMPALEDAVGDGGWGEGADRGEDEGGGIWGLEGWQAAVYSSWVKS
jgi:hypothetical protein